LAALALAAREEERGQSLATCPGFPQNIHKLFSKRRRRSSAVSFPSLPSFEDKSGVEADFLGPWLEPLEGLEEWAAGEDEELEGFADLASFLDEREEGLAELDEEGCDGAGFEWRDCSDLRSQ